MEFKLKAGEVGALLIHGFTGTPDEMRGLGEFLSKNGITSIGILLPGHGTDINDMLKVRWQDWGTSVKESINELKESCNKIFLIGLSMGGTLALHSAVTPDEKIKGIVIMNTPVFSLSNYLVKLVPVFKYIIRFAKKKGKSVKDVLMEQNIAGYNKNPLHGVAELLKLMKNVRKELSLVKIPVIIMHSKLDPTVSWKNAKKIYENIGSIDREIVYFYNSYHVLTMDNDKEEVFKSAYNFIRKWI